MDLIDLGLDEEDDKAEKKVCLCLSLLALLCMIYEKEAKDLSLMDTFQNQKRSRRHSGTREHKWRETRHQPTIAAASHKVLHWSACKRTSPSSINCCRN